MLKIKPKDYNIYRVLITTNDKNYTKEYANICKIYNDFFYKFVEYITCVPTDIWIDLYSYDRNSVCYDVMQFYNIIILENCSSKYTYFYIPKNKIKINDFFLNNITLDSKKMIRGIGNNFYNDDRFSYRNHKKEISNIWKKLKYET